MKPYLAVIRDSFQEALASRVLWILLLMITLILLVIAPLHLREEAGSSLRNEDIVNRSRLAKRVVEASNSEALSPGRRVWELLNEGARKAISSEAAGQTDRAAWFMTIQPALEAAVARKDFYNEEAWKNTPLPAAADPILKKGLDNLPDDERARLNRLALEAAFPGDIAATGAKQSRIVYFAWDPGVVLPFDAQQFRPVIKSAVAYLMEWALGLGGIFVAILVTASMIPVTFEAGSVDLLLSKPVSRGWLFLAKYFGGCAFVGINATYLIGGLCLWMGFAFDAWSPRLLWAIPFYLFLFAIIYSVSAVAGIAWRNSIVAIVIAVVFWAGCFLLGYAVYQVDYWFLTPRKLIAIVPAGESLLGVNTENGVSRWDDEQQAWVPTFAAVGTGRGPRFGPPPVLVGPIYDAANDRILAFNSAPQGFGFQQTGNLLVGSRDDQWQRVESVRMPEGAFDLLLDKDGGVFVVANQGLFRLQGESETKSKEVKVFGMTVLPAMQADSGFINVGPRLMYRALRSAAIDRPTGTIAILDGFFLSILAPDATGKYEKKSETQFERYQFGEVAIGQETVFHVMANGSIEVFDFDLNQLETISTGVASSPLKVTMSDNGRYLVVVFQNATLWLYDIQKKAPVLASIVGQGDISSAAFEGDSLYVTDRLARVTNYDLERHSSATLAHPEMPLMERIYRYALHPLYTIFPKPGKLNDTVRYILTSDDTPLAGMRPDGFAEPPKAENIWGPVWSNLVFIVVVLALGCVYIQRKDF